MHVYRSAVAWTAHVALCSLAYAQTAFLDFEIGGACSVEQASAIELEYAAQGITFVGPTPGAGPVILESCANLAIPPRNGDAYLVVAPGQVSSTGPADGPVTIEFDPPVQRFSTWMQAEQGFGTYLVRGFLRGQLVHNAQVGTFGWTRLLVGNGEGLDRVVIETTSAIGTYMLDDMRAVRCAPSIGHRFCGPPLQYAATSPSCLSAAGEVTGGGPYATLDFTVNGGEPNQFGIVLASRTAGIVLLPGNFNGGLCLAGDTPIARLPNILQFDAAGTATATVDLTAITLTPEVPVLPGETWYFQAWHREPAGGFANVSFSDALKITFEL